jgi:peptide/nickel transport system permease protein
MAACTLLLLCALVTVAGVLGTALGVDATAVDLSNVLLPPLTGAHVLGTDELGRDVLMRLLHGGRVSMAVGVCVAVLSTAWGTLWGMLAGYVGGVVDALLMRITDAMLSVPLLPLLMVVSALQAGSGAGLWGLMVLMTSLGWMTVARLARAATLEANAMEYVLAARSLGASHSRILLVHVLPHALPPVLVAMTLEVGGIILYEAALSFLGLGVKPPLPSWGNMLTHAQDVMYRAPLLAVWPGLFIFITVAAFNLLGDGLRRALDPRQAAPQPHGE